MRLSFLPVFLLVFCLRGFIPDFALSGLVRTGFSFFGRLCRSPARSDSWCISVSRSRPNALSLFSDSSSLGAVRWLLNGSASDFVQYRSSLFPFHFPCGSTPAMHRRSTLIRQPDPLVGCGTIGWTNWVGLLRYLCHNGSSVARRLFARCDSESAKVSSFSFAWFRYGHFSILHLVIRISRISILTVLVLCFFLRMSHLISI